MHRMQPGGSTIRQVKLLRYITAPQDALKRLVLQVAEWLTNSLSESHQLCWGDGDVGMCLMHKKQPGGSTIRQVKLLRYITAPQDALKRLVLQVAEWLTNSLSESHQLCWGDGDVGMCLMHKKQPGGLTIRQGKLLRYKSKLFAYPMLKPTTSNNQSS